MIFYVALWYFSHDMISLWKLKKTSKITWTVQKHKIESHSIDLGIFSEYTYVNMDYINHVYLLKKKIVIFIWKMRYSIKLLFFLHLNRSTTLFSTSMDRLSSFIWFESLLFALFWHQIRDHHQDPFYLLQNMIMNDISSIRLTSFHKYRLDISVLSQWVDDLRSVALSISVIIST